MICRSSMIVALHRDRHVTEFTRGHAPKHDELVRSEADSQHGRVADVALSDVADERVMKKRPQNRLKFRLADTRRLERFAAAANITSGPF